MPPKGSSGLPLILRPILSSLSKSSASIIDTKRTVRPGVYKSEARTFVNDQDLCPIPPRAGFPVLLDLVDELIDILHPQANTGEGMDCYTTNVASGNAYVYTLASQSTRIDSRGV